MHLIKDVEDDSIAQEMGIEPGDMLLSINGQQVADALDYRFMIQEEELLLEIEKKLNNEIWELSIEKDAFYDLGLIFETDLMDKVRNCRNRCLFCFVDQLPKGMRSSLYFKDDDPRLSFLSGNYVTLTNLTANEAQRIADYHLSPLHISVHAADPALRSSMLKNPESGRLFEHLQLFRDAGITMHFQVVLCKGINDGPALDDTIAALMEIGLKSDKADESDESDKADKADKSDELDKSDEDESDLKVSSLSVVPVGLTKFRDGLHTIEPFSQKDAEIVIRQVEKWQIHSRKKYGTSFVFCADEWYIKAKITMPAYDQYEGFPQLENGVGMWSLFEREYIQEKRLKKEIDRILKSESGAKSGAESDMESCMEFGMESCMESGTDKSSASALALGIVTGQAAFGLMQKLRTEVYSKIYSRICSRICSGINSRICSKINSRIYSKINSGIYSKTNSGFHPKIYPITNNFFGPTVTVSGLLTGRDIIDQIGKKAQQDGCKGLLLPRNMFRAGTETTLDDMTLSDIEKKLGLPCWIPD